MKLKKLDEFYQQLQQLDIRLNQVEGDFFTVVTTHYNGEVSSYAEQLAAARCTALSILLRLPLDQIRFNANRLHLLNERFERFWPRVDNSFARIKRGDFPAAHFLNDLRDLVTINVTPQQANESVVNDDQVFISDLVSAMSERQKSVQYLLYELKTITGLEPQLKESSQERTEEEEKLSTRLVSYKWINGDPDQELLVLYKLVAAYIVETPLDDFKLIFSGLPSKPATPVNWKGSPSELLYFIRSLSDKGLIQPIAKPMDFELLDEEFRQEWITTSKPRAMSYLQLKSCFVKADGRPFDCDFKTLNNKLIIDLADQKKEHIDHLLATFL